MLTNDLMVKGEGNHGDNWNLHLFQELLARGHLVRYTEDHRSDRLENAHGSHGSVAIDLPVVLGVRGRSRILSVLHDAQECFTQSGAELHRKGDQFIREELHKAFHDARKHVHVDLVREA